MSERFEAGDHVAWNSEAGHVSGRIIKVHTQNMDSRGGATTVTLGMVFATEAEFQQAKGFGAVELGLQTLGKLERFVKSR